VVGDGRRGGALLGWCRVASGLGARCRAGL
jgi:hypothetical protein